MKVVSVKGNELLLKTLEKQIPLEPGEKIKIYLEKKIIAIRDSEVIMGRSKEVAHYLQEDITTALVNSGRLNVVERIK